MWGEKRRRSNDGTSNHAERTVPIRESLVYAVLGAPTPRVRREPRIFNGPNPRKMGCGNDRASDEQVLEMRRMRDHLDMSYRAIADATGFDRNYVYAVVNYVSRCHLDPGPRP